MFLCFHYFLCIYVVFLLLLKLERSNNLRLADKTTDIDYSEPNIECGNCEIRQ